MLFSIPGLNVFSEESHVHIGEWVPVTEASCTTDGQQKMICTVCGETVFEPIPAGHLWKTEYTVDIKPTYALPGKQSIYCAVCGEKKENSTTDIPALPLSTPEVSVKGDGYDQFQISWTPVTGAEQYRIYRKAEAADWISGEQDWKSIATVPADELHLTDTDVFCGVSYSYAVSAVCGENEGTRSAAATAKTSLSVPEIAAVANSYHEATLTWAPVDGATGYRLYRKTESGGWKRIQDLQGNMAVTYTDASCLWKTAYRYTVRAFREQNGARGYSNYSRTGTTITTAQVVPSVKTVSSYSKINIQWNQISGAEGYRVYRRTASSSWRRITTLSGGDTLQFSDKTANYGTLYFYTVRAYHMSDGEMILSAYNPDGTKGRVFLNTPSLKSVSAKSYSKIQIDWTPVAGASGYYLYRKTEGGCWKRIQAIAGQATSSYTDASALTGIPYRYTVKAYRTVSGKTYYSAYDKTGLSAITSLSTPALKSAASAAYNKIKITWTTVAGADGYYLYRKTAGGSWKRMQTLKGQTVSSAVDSTAVTGTSYLYTVKAYRMVNGNPVYSAYDKSGIQGTAKLSRPTLQSAASADYYKIKLTWKAVPGASGYQVYRSSSETGTYAFVKTVGGNSSTSFTDTGLACGTTYYYKTRAYRTIDGVRVYSGFSSVLSAKPLLAQASAKAVSGGYDRVKVTWSQVRGASGYQIYRKTSKTGSYSALKEITDAETLSFTDTTCICGKTYYYCVRAYRMVNGKKIYGKFSSAASAKPVPSKPAVTAKSAGYDRIRISWKEVCGASGYQVYRASSKDGSYRLLKTLKGAAALSYTNTGLLHRTPYYYKVRAYRTVGDSVIYGTWSGILSAKPISVPDDTITGTSGTATGSLTWPTPRFTWLSSYWGDGRGHKGIDIAGASIYGTSIVAADGGIVKSVNRYDSWGGGYGYYVVIDHGNNYTTMYAHCSKVSVQEGQKVTKGQCIAKVGSTGDSSGPHLHFEIRYQGTALDPMKFYN